MYQFASSINCNKLKIYQLNISVAETLTDRLDISIDSSVSGNCLRDLQFTVWFSVCVIKVTIFYCSFGFPDVKNWQLILLGCSCHMSWSFCFSCAFATDYACFDLPEQRLESLNDFCFDSHLKTLTFATMWTQSSVMPSHWCKASAHCSA